MGLICSTAQTACLCGSAACSFCCTQCPSCRNSTSTRIAYALMLMLSTILACIALAPGLKDLFKKLPFCTNSTANALIPSQVTLECDAAAGYLAVYRICFATAAFFFLMSAIMIGVKSSKDARAGIQNGFWAIKYLILFVGIIGAFFIPGGSFGSVWMYFGMIGGFLFILIQLILIIDFAHNWADSWVENYEETESRGWYAALLGATFFNYILSIIGVVLLYTYFTASGDCGLNKFFIIFNFLLCILMSSVSILPKIQEHQPRSGLLQSSVLTLYIIYLTWSSISNSPHKECVSGPWSNASDTTVPDSKNEAVFDKESIIGLIIWFSCVLYSSLRTASKSNRITMTEQVLVKDNGAVRNINDQSLIYNEVEGRSGDVEDGGSKVWDNEEESLAYNWSFFHFMFALATMYVMMTLTNWYQPNEDTTWKSINANTASMWVKAISAWTCIGLYIWSLIAPAVLTNRDFS
ncbi:serine incorporator 1 isoform X1 [Copidosoma floridanum]|uniref:serine incorporator 1 isoform X1 n=1 Tax=Copidosoma floridanum TaxID=29053 RepID=UPI0006C9DE85|nr:serine incorporator 1 isoform X1 [Copidosoma floridanum]